MAGIYDGANYFFHNLLESGIEIACLIIKQNKFSATHAVPKEAM
jgi:hypothetical protein